MAHADDMINIAQAELEQLVGKDTRGVGKTEQRVVRVDGAQTHGAGMQDGFMAQAAQTGMAMDNIDALPQDDIAEDGEE